MAISIHPSLVLCLLLSFVSAHPSHNVHHGVDHFHQRRQEGGAPFAGIEMISTPGVPLPIASPLTAITRTSQLTASSPENRPSGPTTNLAAGSGTIGPFPVTIVPVPIATICSSGLHPTSIPSHTSLVWSPGGSHLEAGTALPAAATALLRLDSAESNDTSAPVPTFTAYDGLGCSTLYTRTSSAICATVLRGLGALPVSVTDCGQSITFSTSTGSRPVATSAISGDDNTTEQDAPMRKRVVYFIAPWHNVVEGQVPSSVFVQDCVQGMGEEACILGTESWSVVNQTSSVGVTRRVTFEGPITGPAVVTLGGGLFTTNVPASTTALLSIHSNITTTIPTVVPSLSRSAIGSSVPLPEALTATAAGPLTTTQTVQLEAVSHTTVTIFQTLTSTVQHQVTRERNAVTTG